MLNLLVLLWEKCLKNKQKQFKIKTFKKHDNDNDSPLISKQKEIFNKLSNKRLEEITELDKKVNPDDLIYKYKGPTADEKFKDNALDLINKLREGKIRLADAKNDQMKFKSDLEKIKKVNKKIDQKSKKKL